MKRLALVIVALLSIAASGSQANLSALKFGMSHRDIEKILGTENFNRDFTNAEIDHVRWYRHSQFKDILPEVYYDRDYKAVAFAFSYVKQDNGGNDPKTGKPWSIPPDLSRFILSQFSEGTQWLRMKPHGDATIFKSSSGKVFARISAREIMISDREALLRLSLSYR